MMGDERLVEAVAAGDGQALRELFDRHAPWVAARLRRTMPAHAVEDALQDDAERTASRSLPTLRFGHLAGLLAWAALSFLLVALLWGRGSAALVLLRDLAGLSGLALLTARALGSRLSWTLPVAFVTIIPLVGRGSQDSKWAWVDQPAGDSTSWALAIALFVTGLGLVCLSGTRDSTGEAQ